MGRWGWGDWGPEADLQVVTSAHYAVKTTNNRAYSYRSSEGNVCYLDSKLDSFSPSHGPRRDRPDYAITLLLVQGLGRTPA